MKNLLKLNFYALLVVSLFLVSCKDDDPDPQPQTGSEGFFIVNEGAWGGGNASLSFYDKETGAVTNDLFYNANGETPLGDQAQSMTVHGDFGYIVVQNSAKMEVINADDYTSVATIDDQVESPRYFVGYSDTKGFLSDWGADGLTGTVKVIDLNSNTVSASIPTGQGPNQMLLDGDKLYVTHSGGFGRDNRVVVIDATAEEVVDEISVGDNPNSIQKDADGNLWVLTSGFTAYDENWNVDEENSVKGSMVKLSASGSVLNSLAFPELGSPTHLSISPDGQTLYYSYNGAVYSMATSENSFPRSALVQKAFYGLAIDPIDGSIIGCEAPDFSSPGTVYIYDASGTLTSSHQVGIAPNGCAFK